MAKTRNELVGGLKQTTEERDIAIKYAGVIRNQLRNMIMAKREVEAKLQHTLRLFYAVVKAGGGAIAIPHAALAELPDDLELAVDNPDGGTAVLIRIPTEEEIAEARAPEELTLDGIRRVRDAAAADQPSLIEPDPDFDFSNKKEPAGDDAEGTHPSGA